MHILFIELYSANSFNFEIKLMIYIDNDRSETLVLQI